MVSPNAHRVPGQVYKMTLCYIVWGVERPLALGRSLARGFGQAPATKKPTRPVRKSKKVGRSSDHRVCVRETPCGGVCLCLSVLCRAVCLCFRHGLSCTEYG